MSASTAELSSSATDSDDDQQQQQQSVRDIQREFVEMYNVDNLFGLVWSNKTLAESKCLEVLCISIVSTVSVIINSYDRIKATASDKFFIEFAEETKNFLRAGAAQKLTQLDNVALRCEQLAEQLHDRVCVLRADEALIPKSEPLTTKRFCDQQLLSAYTVLLYELDRFRDLRRQQALVKAEQQRMRTAFSDKRLGLFGRALKDTPATHAPPSPGASGSACHVCSSEYTVDGDHERLTLACCDHKQAICRQCFTAASYQDSGEGIKSFARCPFCRTEYTLYESKPAAIKRRRVGESSESRARRNLHFDDDPATPPQSQ